MKKVIFLFLALGVASLSYGQWSTSGTDIYNTNSGRVGIGTSTPSATFDVSKSDAATYLYNTTGSTGAYIKQGASGNYAAHIFVPYTSVTASHPLWYTGIADDASAGYSIFTFNGSGFTQRMRITEAGNVGIGVTSPGEKLVVNGNIRTKKLIVTQSGWSDYVFDSDYRLRSLGSLQSFIRRNKHLPDMPSAKEVEEQGVNVGDTQALLLKKIEELTLYIIRQDAKINALAKRMKKIENKGQGK
jgi:hypothetical protein